MEVVEYVHSAVMILTRVMRTIIRVIARATEERITATKGSMQVSVNRLMSSSSDLDWLSFKLKLLFKSSSSFFVKASLSKLFKSSLCMSSLLVSEFTCLLFRKNGK